MTSKTCPCCKQEKSIEQYAQYFCKQRQKYRYDGYCKICAKVVRNKNAKIYYKNNKEIKLQYAHNYRIKNAEKIKQERSKHKKRQVQKLNNNYVKCLLTKSGFPRELIGEDLLEARRLLVKIKRKTNEKQDKRP